MTRVAIIGAGITGAAAAWALVREGHDVVVYEQFEPGTARGSSHGRSRIFRFAYTDPHWVERAREALVAWRELERETGETLLELDGLLELSPTVADSSRPVLEECGVAWRDVDPAAYGVRGPEGWIATLQPDAGITRADIALRVFLRGVDVRSGVRVESLDDLDTDVVVVAAGPWARPLLARSGIELPVVETRETLAYLGYRPQVGAFVDRNTDGHLMYALRDPVHGLKAGAHMTGVQADPDDAGEPDHELVARVVDWVRERVGDAELVGTETCWYTTTRDESFVLERHGRVVVASPCSGHAFKFAPITGRRIAALVSNGQEPGPLPG